VPYLNVMTRIDGRTDDELLYDLGGSEHPSFFFLDASGDVLGRLDPYDTSVKALEVTGAKVLWTLHLKKKADAGDAAARAELLIARCDLLVTEFSDLEAELEGLALTADQAKAVEVLRADATVSDMMQVLRKNRDEAAKSLVAEEFLALYAQGTHPARPGNIRFYWAVIAGQAAAKKDVSMLKAAIAGLKAAAGAEPVGREAQQLKELEERLKEIEAAK
jgi:hypothetical protein